MDRNDQNDPFERYFKKKSAEYDISYNENDWHKLEKRLDLLDAKIASKNRTRMVAAAAILIISLLGYFTYENHTRLNQISDQLDSERSQPIPQFPQQQILPNFEDEDQSIPDQRDEFVAEDISKHTTDKDSQTDPGREQHLTEEPDPRTWTGREYLNDMPDIAYTELPAEMFTPNRSLSIHEFKKQPAHPSLDYKTDPGDLIADSRAARYDTERSRFSFGVVAGPDLSSVGSFNQWHDPGYKLGIMFEYNLLSNLSLTTGAIHTLARYSTDRQSYNPPVYWADGVGPEQMTGQCFLIDIPINLKYDFIDIGRSRFYLSAGISSYIMISEEYQFRYSDEYSQSIQQWSDRTGTRHWMSNANFSIGYEFDIHPNWSLRAEPFIKAPIREVGWSNVKLYSSGSFFSIHYRLN
ncbi:hypothetical protein DYD21_13690 [Rhodohalobacter sp. SW132]|uniref:hypothetical protein n=1 Tax=Rhodohalobacter sp. SW132 TaxID=2293433 RepID=UPI000E22F6D5|nr:hypothetical protein [Rhodohalobacter sp. SW132]REL32871.1 hypothetical protein DYD21_13690 [Rhodohalobacter sp. SW132]